MHTASTSGREFLVGIDSDGCAFDTMELKHKQVFIPQAIESLRLQAIADEYRAVAERVNLYSQSRGKNRFEALATCLDYLRKEPKLAAGVPDPTPIWTFVRSGRALSNDSFAAYLDTAPTSDTAELALLRAVLDWSAQSNRKIAATVVDTPPFRLVRESLTAAHQFAQTMIVSATPAAALRQEWGHAGLLDLIDVVAGQEQGPKTQQLAGELSRGYRSDRAIMIGDAPGDHRAAQDNGILFFPIVPGRETESWQQFADEGLDRFRSGTYGGAYEQAIVGAYYRALDEFSLA